jgi:hypothetical protein
VVKVKFKKGKDLKLKLEHSAEANAAISPDAS